VKADFGAVMDGSTNDGTALINALSALQSTGGTIQIPNGILYIGNTQIIIDNYKGINFLGVGTHEELNLGTVIKSTRTDGNPAILIGETVASHGLHFRDISFRETGQGQATKIGGTSASSISFDNCDFRRTNGTYDNDTVDMINVVAIDFNNCSFRNHVASSDGGSVIVIGDGTNWATTVTIRGSGTRIYGNSTNKREIGINAKSIKNLYLEGTIFQYLSKGMETNKLREFTANNAWFEDNTTDINWGLNTFRVTLTGCAIDSAKITGTTPRRYTLINNRDLDDEIRVSAVNHQYTAIKTKSTLLSPMSGATHTWTNAIPAGSQVLGVTAYVTTLIEGATTMDIGDGTDADIFVDGMAVAKDTTADLADCNDGTLLPTTYKAATNIVVTAIGGAANFSASFKSSFCFTRCVIIWCMYFSSTCW